MSSAIELKEQTVFTLSVAEILFFLLIDSIILVLSYADVDFMSSRVGSSQRYWDEYVRFRFGKVNVFTVPLAFINYLYLRIGNKYSLTQSSLFRKASDLFYKGTKPPTVILQHDADALPERTLDMMKREQSRGLTSSCFFFAEHAEGEPYEMDVDAMQQLEAEGFEIGYHQNAYERANYDYELTLKLLESDLDWLQERFNIRSFVPHGGVPSTEGLNNASFPHKGALMPLFWAYNGNCMLKDFTWSDGGIHKRTPQNPLDFINNLVNGSRAMMLMHPQYYGERLRDDWEKLPIAREAWWRNLWNL